jgi:hypothetical protein
MDHQKAERAHDVSGFWEEILPRWIAYGSCGQYQLIDAAMR